MKKKIIAKILIIALLCTTTPAFASNNEAENITSIGIGDYVQLGSYYGEPIVWRCVDIDENGPLMLSDKVICLKAFDAAGEYGNDNNDTSHGRDSGSSVHYRKRHGSNLWADSNLRTWLNSTAPVGGIIYPCGNPPNANNVEDRLNAYETEAGFLSSNNFTKNELSLIKEVRTVSVVNENDKEIATVGSELHQDRFSFDECLSNYDAAYKVETIDRIFCLNIPQLLNAEKNIPDIIYSHPTQTAVSRSEYKSNDLSDTKIWPYWLRDAMPANSVRTHVRNAGWQDKHVYFCWANDDIHLGVRPAFYLNTSHFNDIQGSGTKGDPFSQKNNPFTPQYYVGKLTGVDEGSDSLTVFIDNKEIPVDTSITGLLEKVKTLINKQVVYKVHLNKILKIAEYDERFNTKVTFIPDKPLIYLQHAGRYKESSVNVRVKIGNPVPKGFEEDQDSLIRSGILNKKIYAMQLVCNQDIGSFGDTINSQLCDFSKSPKLIQPGEEYNYTSTVYLSNNEPNTIVATFASCKVLSSGLSNKIESSTHSVNAEMKVEGDNKEKPTNESKKLLNNLKRELKNMTNQVIISDPVLLDLFEFSRNDKKLKMIQSTIAYELAMATIPKETFEAEVSKLFFDKVFDWRPPNSGVKYKVPIDITLNTKKYGRVTVRFTVHVTSFGMRGNPFANFGKTEYEIIGGENINPLNRKGIAGFVASVDGESFANSAYAYAKEVLENNVYGEVWGKTADEVVSILFNKNYQKVMAKVYPFSKLLFDVSVSPVENSARKIRVNCPVDIYVYDSKKNLCGAIEKNIVTKNSNKVLLNVEDDSKYITLIGRDYYLEYVGTGEGVMDISIEEYTGTDGLLRTMNFVDIPLEKNVKYSEDLSSPIFVEDSYILSNDKQQRIECTSSKIYLPLLNNDEENIDTTSPGGSPYPLTQRIVVTHLRGGKIAPAQDVVIAKGSSQTFTIVPDPGYEIADVLVDGKSVGAVGSYTFENVTSDHTISATFKKKEDKDPEADALAKKIKAAKNVKIKASSSQGMNKKGRRYIKVKWTKKGAAVTGYQVYRSFKKKSGFKKFYTTKKKYYYNTKALRKGKCHYYKVRSYTVINGKKYYSKWSNLAYRTVKR